ncbi:MAG: DUF111 family protein, partial [bacterium]|nr:DUF111 family protein [bacterium]
GGWGPLPPRTISACGFGAGHHPLQDRPNLTHVLVGTMAASRPQGQPVMLFETNVDDATGETLAHTVTSLLEAGAHDAWITPIIMKKGRPAHKVSVLCDRAVGEQVAATLSGETGSLGVRGQQLERWPQARLDHEVDVDGRRIRVKVSAGRVKVEHDEAVRASRLLGLPAREVVSLAEEAWRRRGGDQPVA